MRADMPAVSIFDDVYASVIGSLQRCLATTQSTALPELLEAMDGPLAAFCERVAGAVDLEALAEVRLVDVAAADVVLCFKIEFFITG